MSTSNTSLYQSSNSSTSTLRPRNPRLISFLDDDADSNTVSGAATSSSSSKASQIFDSGGSAPTPGVSRTKSLNQGRDAITGRQHSRKTSEGGPSAGTDYWSSWSSIASSFLGTDATQSKGKGRATHKQPRWMKQDKSYTSSPTSPHWGPNTDSMTSALTNPLEDRQAMLQAKKRETLLMASSAETRDLNGRFKRRDSSAYSRDEDTEEDALVYMHKIKREDTLAGVMLKYGCQPDVFRKVNRFWPNDNIQTRKQVFLPVEACNVRGKKVDEPDLLALALEDVKLSDSTPTATRSLSQTYDGEMTGSPQSGTSRTISNAAEHGLQHDSWVTILSFADPVEILRMPRKSLGYFPRARRKSNAILTDTSTNSTPKTSFDLLRHPPTHAAQVSASLNASPIRRPLRPPSGTRQRSSSTTSTQTTFADALRGPGGVGTLRGLRTEPSRPGPADDALNKRFQHYFPDITIAPPEDIPRMYLSSSSRPTPRASTDSVRSNRSNSSGLGDMPGALEGFVRKFAGNKTAKPSTKMGDLIELETNSDLGEPILDDEDMNATPTASSMNVLRSQQEERDLLDERFPARGRVMNAYGGGGGKDKG